MDLHLGFLIITQLFIQNLYYQMKKSLIRLFFMSLLSLCAMAQEIDLKSEWKFNKGDNMLWADPAFDDKDWKNIELNRFWEFQGYDSYDGYAWYRTKVTIPSSFMKNSYLKDSLKLLLGKIDDHDQVYLNGELIGQNAGMPFKFGSNDNTPNGSAYNKDRRYAISVKHKAIKWDMPNVIAIRVFDQLGNGGMGDGKKYSISMVDVIDYVRFDANENPYKFQKDGSFSKTLVVKSVGPENMEFNGILSVVVTDNFSKKQLMSKSVSAKFTSKNPFSFDITMLGNENMIAKYAYKDAKTGNGFSETQEIPFLLTPTEKPEPKINGAKVFGARPGNPFLYKIAASGELPLTYAASNLPKGLTMNATGLITGTVNEKGQYIVKITVSNAKGKTDRDLKIIIGDNICLTPQMGWNSWNCWGLAVSDDKVRSSAKAMVEKGLINYGWTYMNIDDGWEGKRDANGVLQTNEKFPDMKKLSNDVHNMGLKLGIYSSPGPKTCGGYAGSYGYVQKDIDTWADWGIDYLKYDWCSYSEIFPVKEDATWSVKSKDTSVLNGLKKPYRIMQKAITSAKRDMVYSLCQYGWGDVWQWGAEVNGQSWRTTGDIEDTWQSMAGIGFKQSAYYPYAKPGRWNDPDMLVVGKVGWGPSLRNSRLTVNEQYTHISLWSLLASPLLIGCDMSQLDDFTLNLLKNSEVIDVNQDPLGKQAQQVVVNSDYQVWVKELEDGSKAIGIFNVSNNEKKVTLNWSDIKINGTKTVRDVWRQKDIGKFESKYETYVASHGVALIRIY